jgi:tetratricopeptide (TPR) repeat protein
MTGAAKVLMFFRLNRVARPALLTALVMSVAFCKPLLANPLDQIDNETLRAYTTAELQRGAWSLQVPARAIYCDAMEILEAGDREGARRKLILASELSGDYPDPMFALARIELRSGNPDFIIHLTEGYKRKVRSFYGQVLAAANLVILSITVSFAVLFITLIFLTVRHWPEYDHKITEMYGGKYAFPPARFIGPLIILGLLIARTGVALYSAILIAVLWPVIGRKEKAAILTSVIFISVLSIMTPRLGSLTAAVDEGSITRRLTMINEGGADWRLIRSIESIEDERFSAEKEFALGTLKSRMGMYNEARDHLLACVSQREDFAPAYLNLGNVYFRQGDFNRALAGYQSVIAIDSTSALAWFNIGQTYINKMLFAESSDALEKAREFGIEDYRAANPATTLLEPDIYDCGFPVSSLWRIALAEGKGGSSQILNGIFRPYLLFPVGRVWILLAAAVLVGSILARLVPNSWKVYFCSNCSLPACSECSDSETGITLCHNCAAAINGLSSVKVMEALLRHRRQKVRSRKGRGAWWKMRIVPGSSKIILGSPWKGMLIASIAASAFFLLVWNGFYLEDPRGAGRGTSMVHTASAATVILICWMMTIRSKKPRDQINYRILPADFHPAEPKEKKHVEYSDPPAGDRPAEPPAEQSGRRFTEQDTKAQEAFREYLETL